MHPGARVLGATRITNPGQISARLFQGNSVGATARANWLSPIATAKANGLELLGVLIEVPVMLLVVKVVNSSKHWYELQATG